MSIDEIIEYVMNTMDSTNPAVLKDMLKTLDGSVNIDEIMEYVMNTPDNTNERVLRDMFGAAAPSEIKIQAIYDVNYSTLPYTYEEMKALLDTGNTVVINDGYNSDYNLVTDYGYNPSGQYYYIAIADGVRDSYWCEAATDYPRFSWE